MVEIEERRELLKRFGGSLDVRNHSAAKEVASGKGEEEKKGIGQEATKAEEAEKGKKKNGAAATPEAVVLHADLHCDGCTKKIEKSITRLEGVDTIVFDTEKDTITVRGKADPWTLKESIESKAKKAVTFISPANPPKKKDGEAKKSNAGADADKKSAEKPKEPIETTTVLKIPLHCVGCTKRIQRLFEKMKGVYTVVLDDETDLVTVRGVVDPNILANAIKKKMKRSVEILPPKKDEAPKGKAKGDAATKAAAGEKMDAGGNVGNPNPRVVSSAERGKDPSVVVGDAVGGGATKGIGGGGRGAGGMGIGSRSSMMGLGSSSASRDINTLRERTPVERYDEPRERVRAEAGGKPPSPAATQVQTKPTPVQAESYPPSDHLQNFGHYLSDENPNGCSLM